MGEQVTGRDRAALRDAAKSVAEIAGSPVMQGRIKAWTDHNDLKPTRAMALIELGGLGPEIGMLLGAYPKAGEFLRRRCEGDFAATMEERIKGRCLSHLTVDDDSVVDACYDLGWEVGQGDYGVHGEVTRGRDGSGRSLGYKVDPPIKDIAEAPKLLRARRFTCDKAKSLEAKAVAEDLIGDILEVRMRRPYWWTMGMTWRLIDLVGMEAMMVGMVEDPDSVHWLMGFLCEDHIAFAEYLESEGLFCANTGNDYIGSGSRGYVSPRADGGPGVGPNGGARLRDNWVLLESQETTCISPGMFAEFIYPYQKRIADRFGHVYYGCCEPVEGRMRYLRGMGNLRSVSVSPWSDQEAMAAECAGRHVFSRKPAPSLLSGFELTDGEIMADVEGTARIASGCSLEIVMKDLHTVNGDISRVRRWVDAARAALGTVGK